MGTCANPKRKNYEYIGDMEPENTEEWNVPNSTEISFSMKLSNVKLKGLPYDQVFVIASLQGHKDIQLDRKRGPGTIKWTFEQVLKLSLTEYQLRKAFLTMSVFAVFQSGDLKVAEIKFNLYMVATGPYHHDFPIRYANKSEGRLSVDIRMAELVELELKSGESAVWLNDDRMGQKLHYTLKAVSSSFKAVESQGSYDQELKAHKIQPIQSIDKKQPSQLRTSLQEAHHLVWTPNEAKKLGGELPSLNLSILASQIPNACVQFLLWKLGKAADGTFQQTMLLIGQCYISFNKILNNDFSIVKVGGREFQRHQVTIRQKMWFHGRYIGDVQSLLLVDLPKYYRQMHIYVRTEMGIAKSSPAIISQNSKAECLEIIELSASRDKIQAQLNNLQRLHRDSQNINDPESRSLRMSIQMELANQLQKLESSKKQASVMYNYRSEADILKAQEVFIDIGFRLLMIVEDDDRGFRDVAFRCLVALMRRGQLTLAYMGFKPEEKQALLKNQKSKYLTQKYDLALKFQTFLYHILRNVLTFLNQKALQENQRMFVELFCAYSYFRVPQFRQELLSILKKPDDPDISQWRGTEFSLDDEPVSSKSPAVKKQSTFDLLFDWQINFYDCIADDDRSRQNLQDLNEIIHKQSWRHRMAKRGIGFFFFIIYWIKYIEKIAIISQNVKWSDIPGYPQLLKALLCQMKRRPIVQYPDSLIDASTSMLKNDKLLSPFISIIFGKTNIYDSNMVLKTIELVSKYFSSLNQNKRAIPTSFNYNFFISGLKNIIVSEHSYAIAKTLLLYYDHYNMFNYVVRKDLNMFLLGRAFFRLFLNWSLNVRVIFHHLLIFRIRSQYMNVGKERGSHTQYQFYDSDEFNQRYDLVIKILENAKDRKEQDDNLKFGYNYEKEYYKKMRKKVQDQRRLGNKNPHLVRRIDNSNVQPTKYTIEELSKNIGHRSRSEAVPVKVTYDMTPVSSTELTKYLSDKSEPKWTTQQVESQKKNKGVLKRLTSHESDFELAEMNINYLEYLSKSLYEFHEIEQKYQKFYSNANQKGVPTVDVKVPIDEVELRPFHIDQW